MTGSNHFDNFIFIFENDSRDHFSSFIMHDVPVKKSGSSQVVNELRDGQEQCLKN